jgi:fibronectin-binding autotransporter adhesin
MFYGAAGSKADAQAALASVGSEVSSIAWSAIDPSNGTPSTFAFGYASGYRAPLYWAGDTGTWNPSDTTAHWHLGTAGGPLTTWSPGATAIFDSTAQTVALSALTSVNSIIFDTGGYNITGSSLSAAYGSMSVIVQTGTDTISSSITDPTTGQSSIIKAGPGTLVLNGTDTYSGGTVINAGNLKFNTSNSLPGTGQITINSQGALIAAGDAYSTAQAWISSGRILNTSTGSLALTANEGNINLSTSPGYSTLSIGAIGNVTYTGAITPSGNTYYLGGGSGVLDLRGTDVLKDNGGTPRSIVINGLAEVIISGDNSLSGLTTVNIGTLMFGDGISDGSVNGDITINSGTSLIFDNYYEQTYDGIISGQGDFIVSNYAALILTNDNDISGETIINGTLDIFDGSFTSTQTTIWSGTLQICDGISSDGSITGVICNYGTLFFDIPYGYGKSYAGHIGGDGETIVSEGSLWLTGVIDNNVTLINNGALYINDNASVGGLITINYSCFVCANIPLNMEKRLSIDGASEGILEKTGQGTLHVDSCNYDLFYGNIENDQGTLYLEVSPIEGFIENNGTLIIDVQSWSDSYCDGIVYGNGNLVKTGGGTYWISQINYSGTISINEGTLAIDSGTISGEINGEGALKKYNGGHLTLSGVSYYSGDTIIDSGTLELASWGQLIGSQIDINEDGTFLVTGGNSYYYKMVPLITGNGTLTIGTPNIAGYLQTYYISPSVTRHVVYGDLFII